MKILIGLTLFLVCVTALLGCGSSQRLTGAAIADEQLTVTAYIGDVVAGYPQRQSFYDTTFLFCDRDTVRTKEFRTSVTEMQSGGHTVAYYGYKLKDLNHKLEILKGTAR